MVNNNSKLYDVVVPLLKVDLPTLQNNIPYLKSNLPCKRIVVIGNSELKKVIDNNLDYYFVDEDNLFEGLTFEALKQIKTSISGNSSRTGWYFQQFLKMAYSKVCQDEYYLIWDADTIPIRKIDFFDKDGKPFLDYIDYKSYDECYTPTQLALLPGEVLKKKEHKSFITEHMFVNVKIMRNLIDDLTNKSPYSKSSFYENIMYSIPSKFINLSGFSEFECYAAYVLNVMKGTYTLRRWKNLRNAKTYIGDKVTDDNLKWMSSCFNVISIEDFDSQWGICKIIRWLFPKIKFMTMYNMINPSYQFYYKLRIKIRQMIK